MEFLGDLTKDQRESICAWAYDDMCHLKVIHVDHALNLLVLVVTIYSSFIEPKSWLEFWFVKDSWVINVYFSHS